MSQHGSEGVSIKKLKEELNSRRSQHLMGRESINDALTIADRNGDDYLSFAEFFSMVRYGKLNCLLCSVTFHIFGFDLQIQLRFLFT